MRATINDLIKLMKLNGIINMKYRYLRKVQQVYKKYYIKKYMKKKERKCEVELQLIND